MKKRTLKKLLVFCLAATMAAGTPLSALADMPDTDTGTEAYAVSDGGDGTAEDASGPSDGGVLLPEEDSGGGMTEAVSAMPEEDAPEASSAGETSTGYSTEAPAAAETGLTAEAAQTADPGSDSLEGLEIEFDEDLGLDAAGTGFVRYGSSIRYFYKGVMVKGWRKIGRYTYYFDSSGNMAAGLRTINNFIYYFGSGGRQTYGWQTISGKKYYFFPETAGKHYKGTAARGFCTIKGKEYYFNKNGTLQTGWYSLNGFRYYSGADGVMRTGWQTIGGRKYYFFGSTMKQYKRHYKGTAATCLNKVGNSWYYMDPSTGACQSGWKDFEGLKYYFRPGSCKAATGTVKIGGRSYTFSSNGVLKEKNYFSITMIDIGGGADVWGDQTLLESNGRYLLVDTSISGASRVVKFLKSHKVKNLDILISHFDQDHVGNLNKILKDSYFHVGTVYLPAGSGGYAGNARKYAKKCVIMKEGTAVNFGCVTGRVVYKKGSAYDNNGSAAVMFSGAGIRYFTAGDIEKGSENGILRRGINIKADVFKLSHHGVPETSNQQKFLNRIGAAFYLSNCCGDNSRTMNTWGSPSYSRAKKTGGMVLSSRYNGSFTLKAVNGHITLYASRNTIKKTVTAYNVRTGNYDKIKITVCKNNSKVKSKAVLPRGYRLKK